MLADVRTLVEVESPTADPAAIGRSTAAVTALGTRLLGVAPQTAGEPTNPVLIWDFGPGLPGRQVLLLAHHDTVWPVGSWDSLWREEAGRAYGPGVFDMKAGLVQVFHAVAAIPVAARGGIVVMVTSDEETGSVHSKALISQYAARAGVALVAEAAAESGALKTARRGIAHYRLNVTGRAAHAGLDPEAGINAGVEAAYQVLAIAALQAAHPEVTLTPTTIQAGTTINTVPGAATVAVDLRTATLGDLDAIDQALRALRPVDQRTRIEVTQLFANPPVEPSHTAALFALAGQVAAALGQPAPVGVAVGGGSDGNTAAAAGAMVLDGLGAVGGGAHAAGEHIEVAHLAPRTELLQGLIQAVLDGRVQFPIPKEAVRA
jgi:glutamate carboxypeptidase